MLAKPARNQRPSLGCQFHLAHPAVLGGNIGIPIVERLPELTADHRVVYELSELQLPTLSRGTTVAVYLPAVRPGGKPLTLDSSRP